MRAFQNTFGGLSLLGQRYYQAQHYQQQQQQFLAQQQMMNTPQFVPSHWIQYDTQRQPRLWTINNDMSWTAQIWIVLAVILYLIFTR